MNLKERVLQWDVGGQQASQTPGLVLLLPPML